MIFHELKVRNFGVYKEQTFNLQPYVGERYTRPITMIRGKNGVGKSTIMEAIRLCLHGSLVLGNRVSQREYDEYLLQRIHRTPDAEEQPTEAGITLFFDYVKNGKKVDYRVVRSWSSKKYGRKVLEIYENGRVLEMEYDDKEQFLRELISPGLVELFFFDGEKIRTLTADGEMSNSLLADTVKALLGLDMVDQLANDLDIYVVRQKVDEAIAALQGELSQLYEEKERVESELEDWQVQETASKSSIDKIKASIQQLEQQIANAGGQYAAKRHKRIEQRTSLEINVENQRKYIRELFNGLLPFALVPDQLLALQARLDSEQKIKEAQAAHSFLSEGINDLRGMLTDKNNQYSSETVETDEHVENLVALVKEAFQFDDEVMSQETVLDVSELERTTLTTWISEAQEETLNKFATAMAQLNQLESELDQVKDDLSRVPDKDVIQPLLDEVGEKQKILGKQEELLSRAKDEIERLKNWLDRIASRQQKVREQIEKQETAESKIQLAVRTQKALEAYKYQITIRKIRILERQIKERFNLLCRKKNFIDSVEIDPSQFQIHLQRLGQPFSRSQLSAGEQQLFAIATLWALREISERPMPVIIDTPLSRLDNEHRQTMSQEFFPHVSHQVVVLATDAEVDDEMTRRLEPVTSHIYNMSLDGGEGTTRVEHEQPRPLRTNLLSLEEVEIR